MGTLRTDGGFPLPTGSANGGIFDQVRPGWSLTPLRISLLYLVVGLVGLGLSDLALPRMVAEPLLSRIQALKGITEVVLTAGLIFLLTHTREVQLEADRERLTQQRQELEVIHRVLRHNIRNDINVILLGIESLRESVDDAGSEQIELLIDKIDELTRYTDRAATIREITSGAVDRKRFEVGELLDEAADVVRSDAATGSVSSTVPRSTAVYAHPMLDEALIELVENAIEHTVDAEPTVAIEVCSRMEETGCVEFRIADDGPGLDPNELVALERGKEASLIHLSGMGLWLVNWVVRDSGGYLKFEQSEQGGTLAIVGVPVCSSTSSLLRRR